MAEVTPVRRFRAFDPSGTVPHTVPNVARIDTQLLRPNEWPNTILRETLFEEEFAASLINFDVDNVPCAYCGLDPACDEECHTKFVAEQFSRSLVELRGPLPGRGYGAFVKRGARIVKGQWVGEYIGELRPLSAVDAGIAAGVQSMYRFDFSNDGETVVVDSERRGNWTRFVNSSCVPNLDVAEVQIGKQLAFLLKARRDIEEGEELGYHYGEDYFTAAGMLCGCAAEAGAHAPRPMPLQVQ